ncbi:hypothetical protein RFH42_07920 [Acinetobacter rudis]|uniref:Probable fimbrial chaperone EcpB n=2 Tax=Acinetobacter rudis TaxID=632955 RepID=A0AAW8JBS0_9GAMM|nr:hypothetical protein [Acinetobacter rudis]MDQ8936407.1 hypothetical protein [Acinetobacter rudis]MDQ8952889.1 hypothetical protein [Acinetobacter rudis]MDQ9018642.1 hypothetical protein [Acinetobacter rudis]
MHGFAINVGDVTTIIEAKQSLIAKEIENPSDVARFVGLKVQRISSPMEDGNVIPMENLSEVLSTPSGLVLPGGAKDVFKIIYQGPADDQERYYRLSWLDAPVSSSEDSTSTKTAQASAVAQINTILVVAPRKQKFDYTYKDGLVSNTGNVSFRVVAAGACKDASKDINGKGCRERYYVMPNDNVTLKYTQVADPRTNIGIWHDSEYINVPR